MCTTIRSSLRTFVSLLIPISLKPNEFPTLSSAFILWYSMGMFAAFESAPSLPIRLFHVAAE